MAAYGFGNKKDTVAQVLALNADVAARIKAKQSVTGPGVPTVIADKSTAMSTDCAVRAV